MCGRDAGRAGTEGGGGEEAEEETEGEVRVIGDMVEAGERAGDRSPAVAAIDDCSDAPS